MPRRPSLWRLPGECETALAPARRRCRPRHRSWSSRPVFPGRSPSQHTTVGGQPQEGGAERGYPSAAWQTMAAAPRSAGDSRTGGRRGVSQVCGTSQPTRHVPRTCRCSNRSGGGPNFLLVTCASTFHHPSLVSKPSQSLRKQTVSCTASAPARICEGCSGGAVSLTGMRPMRRVHTCETLLHLRRHTENTQGCVR